MDINLREECINAVAREMARSKVSLELNWQEAQQQWFDLTREMRPAAVEKINAMPNIDLLDLINSILEVK